MPSLEGMTNKERLEFIADNETYGMGMRAECMATLVATDAMDRLTEAINGLDCSGCEKRVAREIAWDPSSKTRLRYLANELLVLVNDMG